MTRSTRRQFLRDVTLGSAATLAASRSQPVAARQATNPGRFELWHIKDVFGLKTVSPSLGPNARVSSMALVPVGTGTSTSHQCSRKRHSPG